MDFGSLDGGEDDGPCGVSFAEIEILAMQDAFFLGKISFDSLVLVLQTIECTHHRHHISPWNNWCHSSHNSCSTEWV